MDFQHQLRQRPVVPACAQRVRQQHPAGVFVQLAVKILQRPIQHPATQKSRLPLVQNPEVRGQAVFFAVPRQEVNVFPQQRRAKRIHGLDVRLIDPQKLAAQVLIAGMFSQQLAKLRGDLAPQFRGSGLRIGDDEEIVDVAVVLQNIEKQPLH